MSYTAEDMFVSLGWTGYLCFLWAVRRVSAGSQQEVLCAFKRSVEGGEMFFSLYQACCTVASICLETRL